MTCQHMSQPICRDCLPFQSKEWDVGVCDIHQVYVPETYYCGKFVLRDASAETLAADTGTANEARSIE